MAEALEVALTYGVLPLLLLTMVLSGGCVTSQRAARFPPAPASAEGALGAGDVVEIRLLQEADLSGTYQIDASGSLGFPYIGNLRVSGMTAEGVAARLQQELKTGGYFVDPVVTVLIKEFNSRLVYVLGSVRNPGSYRYHDGMGVIDAISAAGGVLETGQPSRTLVTRKIDGQERSIQVAVPAIVSGRQPDPSLAVGDIVFVPESPI